MTTLINVVDKDFGYRLNTVMHLGTENEVLVEGNPLWIKVRDEHDIELELDSDLSYLPIVGALAPVMACAPDNDFIIRSPSLKVPMFIRPLIEYLARDRRVALAEYYGLDLPKDVELTVTWEVEDQEVVVRPGHNGMAIGNFSFGKESNLVQILLESMVKAGKIDDYSLTYAYKTGYSRGFFKGVLEMQPFLSKILKVNNNFNQLNGYVNKLNPNVWVDFQMMFQLLPLVIQAGYKYWLQGNELDTTRICYREDDGKSYMHWTLFDESIPYEALLTAVLQKYRPDSVAFSPLLPIFENRILEAVCNHYGTREDGGTWRPQVPEQLISCWFPEKKSAQNGWCGQCTKCERFYRMFKELNIKPPFEMQGTGLMLTNNTPEDLFSEASEKYYAYRELYMPMELVPTIRETILDLVPHLTVSDEVLYPPSGAYLPEVLS